MLGEVGNWMEKEMEQESWLPTLLVSCSDIFSSCTLASATVSSLTFLDCSSFSCKHDAVSFQRNHEAVSMQACPQCAQRSHNLADFKLLRQGH